jgi:hypothetical protein
MLRVLLLVTCLPPFLTHYDTECRELFRAPKDLLEAVGWGAIVAKLWCVHQSHRIPN